MAASVIGLVKLKQRNNNHCELYKVKATIFNSTILRKASMLYKSTPILIFAQKESIPIALVMDSFC